jgi:hypothetical protein
VSSEDAVRALSGKFSKAGSKKGEENSFNLETHMAAARELADRVFGVVQRAKDWRNGAALLVVKHICPQRVGTQHLHIVSTFKRTGIRHGAVAHASAHLLHRTVLIFIEPPV